MTWGKNYFIVGTNYIVVQHNSHEISCDFFLFLTMLSKSIIETTIAKVISTFFFNLSLYHVF